MKKISTTTTTTTTAAAADVDLRGFPCPGAMGDSSGLLPSDFLVVPRQVIRCI